jgi:hypothetical protein
MPGRGHDAEGIRGGALVAAERCFAPGLVLWLVDLSEVRPSSSWSLRCRQDRAGPARSAPPLQQGDSLRSIAA